MNQWDDVQTAHILLTKGFLLDAERLAIMVCHDLGASALPRAMAYTVMAECERVLSSPRPAKFYFGQAVSFFANALESSEPADRMEGTDDWAEYARAQSRLPLPSTSDGKLFRRLGRRLHPTSPPSVDESEDSESAALDQHVVRDKTDDDLPGTRLSTCV